MVGMAEHRVESRAELGSARCIRAAQEVKEALNTASKANRERRASERIEKLEEIEGSMDRQAQERGAQTREHQKGVDRKSKRREGITETSGQTTARGGVSTSSKAFGAGMQSLRRELGSTSVDCMARGMFFEIAALKLIFNLGD
jgi:archaellum component FlaD/FlaE